MRYFIIFLIFIFACNPSAKKETAKEGGVKPKIKVENVHFEQTEEDTWIMMGSVINIGDQPIQGNIKIKLLGSNERTISTFNVPVNQKQPIQPEDSARFRYEGPSTEFAGAKNYQFTFIPQED